MDKLSPHPSRDKWPVENGGAVTPQPWNRWLEDLRTKLNSVISSTDTATTWADIDKTGSDIVDIEARDHADLQNLNSSEYYHLTEDQVNALVGGGDSDLHTHNSLYVFAKRAALFRI